MVLQRTTRLLVGVLLAVALLSVSSLAVAGAPAAELGQQTANETATNATAANDSTANATLGNLTVWTAPSERFANLTSPAAVRTAMRDDWLTRNRTVTEGDTVVFGLPTSGLVESVAAANDTDSDAAAFVAVLNRSDAYDFRMEQTEDTTLAEYRPKRLNLSATLAADGLRVVPDERNGTLYVVLRTDRVTLDRGSGSGLPLRDNEAYEVNTSVHAGNTTASSTARVSVVEPTVSFHTDAGRTVRLGADRRCAFVSGEVGPGEAVSLDLIRADSWATIDRTRTTADESGQFGACINTTGIPGNTTLRIVADGYRGTAKVITAPADHWGSVALSDQNVTNETVTASASLSDPGFLALYRAPSDETGEPATATGRCGLPRLDQRVASRTPIGVSDHLGAGSTDSASIELTTTLKESTPVVAVVHFDRDDDGQFDYPGVDVPPCFNGTVPTDTATISAVGDSSPDSDGETGTVTAGRTTTTRPPTTTSHRDGPGFGLAPATLALLAVALLAHRRQ